MTAEQRLSGEMAEVPANDICKMYEFAYNAKQKAHGALLVAQSNRRESAGGSITASNRANILLNHATEVTQATHVNYDMAATLHRRFCNHTGQHCESFRDSEILQNLDFSADYEHLLYRNQTC